MELDISITHEAIPAGARSYGGAMPRQGGYKVMAVSYQLPSSSRAARNRHRMREVRILLCSIGHYFPRGAHLASHVQNFELMPKNATRVARKGWIDDGRMTKGRPTLGVRVTEGNGYPHATAEGLREGRNADLWANQTEFTEMGASRETGSNSRGRKIALDNWKSDVQRGMADQESGRQASDGATSRSSTENDNLDNQVSFRIYSPDTNVTRAQNVARTDGSSPHSFRADDGNTAARDIFNGATVEYGAEERKSQRGIDLWTDEQAIRTENPLNQRERQKGGRPEQISAAQILPDSEVSTPQSRSGKEFAVGGNEISEKRTEETLGLMKGEQVEEEDRERGFRRSMDIVDSRRLLKRSKMIAKQVISQSSAMTIGFVSQMWVNAALCKVVALEVRPSLLYGQADGVRLNDVYQVGDVILISDESTLESDITVLDREILVGYDLLTEDGYYLGKVRDYSFDLVDGKVTSLEFDSLGFSLMPSNLISTYWLNIEEVIEVSVDSLLVKHGAESRVRRLTKGIWPLPSVQVQVQSQRMAGNRRPKRDLSLNQEVSYKDKQTPLRARQLPPRRNVIFPENTESGASNIKADLRDRRWSPMDYGSSKRKI